MAQAKLYVLIYRSGWARRDYGCFVRISKTVAEFDMSKSGRKKLKSKRSKRS
jgi:hypothetical protein